MLAEIRELLDHDKVKHFVYGLAMAGMLVPFGWGVALVFVTFVAIVKELIDEKETGVFSPADIGTTVFSVFALYAWYELIERISTLM